MNVDYLKIYNELIDFRKENVPDGYTENHHIVPKSLGGDDSIENKVLLTGREHYVAHSLLAKIHKGTKNYYPMINAVWMMQMRCEERGISKIKSSRMYEWVREEHAKQVSKKAKIWSKGKNNSQYGTMWICNLKLKENKKIKTGEEIPTGWIQGRSSWIKNDKAAKKKRKKICDDKKNKEFYLKLYNIMINERLTLQETSEKYYDRSYVWLHKNFLKYIDGYRKTQGKRKA